MRLGRRRVTRGAGGKMMPRPRPWSWDSIPERCLSTTSWIVVDRHLDENRSRTLWVCPFAWRYRRRKNKLLAIHSRIREGVGSKEVDVSITLTFEEVRKLHEMLNKLLIDQ